MEPYWNVFMEKEINVGSLYGCCMPKIASGLIATEFLTAKYNCLCRKCFLGRGDYVM